MPFNKERELEAIALDAIKSHLGISQIPEFASVTKCINAVPQYEVGHFKRVKTIAEITQTTFGGNLTLLGSSYNGVSLNDCTANAKAFSDSVNL